MTGRIKRKSCTSLSHASKQEKNFCKKKNIYMIGENMSHS